MSDSPVALLYDAAGNPVAVKDGDTITPASQPVLPVAGVEGTTARTLHLTTQGGVARLAVDATISDGAGAGNRVKVWDGTDILDILAEAVSTTGLKGLLPLARTAQNLSTFLLAQPDGSLVVASKPPQAPPGTTAWQVAVVEADLHIGSGGAVASPHTTLGSLIPTGKTLTLQSVEVGTEGDSSESGSAVEVYWRVGSPAVDHLIGRYYIAGQTVQVVLPDVRAARDGTAFAGDSTTTRIVVVRRRLSVAAMEVDFVVRGYY